MLEYTSQYWNMLIPFTKGILKRKYGKEYTKLLLVKAKTEYKNMLSEFPDIGKKNPMAGNAYMCLLFLALWKVSCGKIGVDDLRDITTELLSNLFIKFFMGKIMNLNKQKSMDLFQSNMQKCATYIEEHPQYKDTSWDFNFDESLHEQGFYYHFTRCPLYTYAQKQGYLDALQVMCDMDYLTAALMHGTFPSSDVVLCKFRRFYSSLILVTCI